MVWEQRMVLIACVHFVIRVALVLVSRVVVSCGSIERRKDMTQIRKCAKTALIAVRPAKMKIVSYLAPLMAFAMKVFAPL